MRNTFLSSVSTVVVSVLLRRSCLAKPHARRAAWCKSFNNIFIKVCVVSTDSSDSQKLAVRDADIASLWVC